MKKGPKTNSSQEMFVVAKRHDGFGDVLNISVPVVPPGDYLVIVYDLESNGLPVLSTVSNPYIQSAGESDSITVTEPGEDEGRREPFLLFSAIITACNKSAYDNCCKEG